MNIKEALTKEITYLKRQEYLSWRDAEKDGDAFVGSGYRASLRNMYHSYQRIVKDLE